MYKTDLEQLLRDGNISDQAPGLQHVPPFYSRQGRSPDSAGSRLFPPTE